MPITDLSSIIPESQIDPAIARDTETVAAIGAHVGASDPHPIYLTQTEGDGRYLQLKRNIYQFATGIQQGTQTNTTHNLDATKIQSVSALIFINLSINAGFAPRILPGGLASLAGYHYSVNIDAGNIFCRLHPTDSSQLLNRMVSVAIDWL